MMTNGCQPHRRDAAALRAVRLAAELAGGDTTLEGGGDSVRGSREDGGVRRIRWMQKLPEDCRGHVELGMHLSQAHQISYGDLAVARGEDFRIRSSFLWSEETHPHAFDVRVRRPKREEVVKVSRTLHHLRGDSAVNRDPLSRDIFQDSRIGGRLAANIVIGFKSVNGDDKIEARNLCPGARNLAECAGNKLHMDAALLEFGQQDFQFTEADQWIT